MSAGDLDGDGDLDIVATTQGSDTKITTLLNNGNGQLTAQPQVAESSSSLIRSLLVDVNFDGKLDYLATNASGVIVRRFGNGDGTFQASRRIPGVPSQIRMFFEDFTGDGVPDLGVNSAGAPGGLSFGVIVNDGNGNLGPEQQQIMIDEGPMGLAHGDFNEDGKTDVVVANQLLSFWVSFGDGVGSFTDPLVIPATKVPRAVLVGDVNNDGNQDIFAIVQDDSEPNATTWVALGNGNGTFGAPIVSPVNFSDFRNGRMPALVDLNRDGFLDAAMPSIGNSRIAILQGNGNGSFQQLLTLPTPAETRSVVAADLDLDGYKDLAVLAGSVSVFLNNGFFSPQPTGIFPAANTTSHITSADFNGDSLPDLATSTDSIGALNGNPGKVAILLGSGNGGFGAPREYIVGRGAAQMATADFDADGNLDLAVANSGYNLGSNGADSRVTVLYGDGSGVFPKLRDFAAANIPRGMAAIDLDTDGDHDIVTPDWGQSRLTLLKNICLPGSTSFPEIGLAANTMITEGDTSIEIAVTLSTPSTVPVSVDYRTAPYLGVPGLQGESLLSNELSSTVGGRDYVSVSGRLRFAPGETSKIIQFTARGDEIDEFDEYVSLLLSNPINASLGDRDTLITIVDNDEPPSISIGDLSGLEGSSVFNSTFNVPLSLSQMSEKPISLRYVTISGTAIQGSDYNFVQTQITLPSSVSTTSVPVAVIGDREVEPAEQFSVRISDPVNATIVDDQSTVTIENDDIGGTVQFAQAEYSALETANLVTVIVNRTDGNAGGVSLTLRTQAGTATPGQDYTGFTRTIQFGPDETSKQVQVQILRDDLDEPDETILLLLENVEGATLGAISTATLTITDVDDPPTVTISDTQLLEGDSGTAQANLTLALSRPTQREVSVNYATADDMASASSDYQPMSGVISFAPGVTRKSLTVMVNGDTSSELNETFFVNLTSPVGMSISDAQGVITIFNDDQLAATSLAYVSVNRNGTGSGNQFSSRPSVSADGRYVAFDSIATDLVAIPDDNGKFDVFVRDRELGTTRLISTAWQGNGAANCASANPRISANGRFVAFDSCSWDLLGPNGTSSGASVYLRDLESGQTRSVSLSSSDTVVEGKLVGISADGRFVVFQSTVQGVTQTPDQVFSSDIFVRDTVANVTHLVSINAAGTATGDDGSGNQGLGNDVWITPDGRYVLFPSDAGNLTTLPAHSRTLYVRDLVGQTTTPVGVNAAGTEVVMTDDYGSISDDGRYVFFGSMSNAVVAGDTNNFSDVFRRDLASGNTVLLSASVNGGVPGNQISTRVRSSANGRFAVFSSAASNLTLTPDTNNSYDVFWRDVLTGETRLLSMNAAGTGSGNGFSERAVVSADGQFVVMRSTATDLVSAPDNAFLDVFLHDVSKGKTYLASGPASGMEPSNQPTLDGLISADGSTVIFESASSNLLPNDVNGTSGDVFAFSVIEVQQDRTPFDFDGDGKADVAVYRPEDGNWYVYGSTSGFMAATWGLPNDKLVPADYDGDGKTDFAIFRDGVFWILNSSTGSATGVPWGLGTDTPVPADYDGDGKADPAIFRDGTWAILGSTQGYFGMAWGLPTDIPVPADYDGDGKADVAIFRDGIWAMYGSTQGYFGLAWGMDGDKPVPADYDGDGTADPAIFREGIWAMLGSTQGYTGLGWGLPTDIPVPADYDGDGKADPAIYREGIWAIYGSTAGYFGANWGAPTDVPVQRR